MMHGQKNIKKNRYTFRFVHGDCFSNVGHFFRD